MRFVKTRAACAAALMAVSAAGCGGGDDGEGADDAKTPVSLVEGVTVEVRVLDNRYVPAEVTVEPGTEVVFTNDGRNDHNVIPAEEPPSGEFDLTIPTEDLLVGMEARIRYTEPGTFVYYCSIHGTAKAGMVGKIVVES